MTTATLGMDYERGLWLAGVALSRSSGEGSYEEAGMRGEVESSLTGVYPYARYRVSERLSVWGVVGHGQGDMTLEPEGAGSIETDIETSMAAGGARGVVLPARSAGGFELALRADLMATATASDAARNLVETEVETSRLRLLIEASRTFRMGAESALAASAEAGLRYDGGDAETGSGLEVGGSLRYSSGSLTVEVAARGLMAHSEDDYEEWGVSGSVAVCFGPGRTRVLGAGRLRLGRCGGGCRAYLVAAGGGPRGRGVRARREGRRRGGLRVRLAARAADPLRGRGALGLQSNPPSSVEFDMARPARAGSSAQPSTWRWRRASPSPQAATTPRAGSCSRAPGAGRVLKPTPPAPP